MGLRGRRLPRSLGRDNTPGATRHAGGVAQRRNPDPVEGGARAVTSGPRAGTRNTSARTAATGIGGAAGSGTRDVRLSQFSVETAHGPAAVVLDLPRGARGLLALGHGASGGVDAPDLIAVRDAAVAERLAVARITQPYRVQGRRAPGPAAQLDAAWIAAVTETRRRAGSALPLAVGGRSAGARVAARTAAALNATGVLALAFPLHPPGKPESSRAAELDPTRPTLVINGDKDSFGVPEAAGKVRVVVRPGEQHALRRDPRGVAAVAVGWLVELLDLGQESA